jgi:hypothetical protein
MVLKFCIIHLTYYITTIYTNVMCFGTMVVYIQGENEKKKNKNKVTILRTRRCCYDTDQMETLQEHGVRSGRSK